MNIIETQIAQKWKADIERRMNAEEMYQYFRNDYRDILKKELKKIITHDKSREELQKYIESDYSLQRIIDEISLVFQEKAKITILEPKANGEWENRSKAQSELERLLENTEFQITMQEIEKLTNLFFDLPVIPQIKSDSDIRIDIITPDRAFVIQDTEDYSDMTAFFWQIGVLENSPVANPINIYHLWTKEDFTYNNVIYPQGKYQVTITDGRINDITMIEYPTTTFPVVMFRNYKPINAFWYDGKNKIFDKSVKIE